MTNHESHSSEHRPGEPRVLGVLALELTPGSPVARDALAQDAAGQLAALVARDLAKLQSVRTSDGQGLREFLDDNLHLFEPEVSDEINLLAAEVLTHGE